MNQGVVETFKINDKEEIVFLRYDKKEKHDCFGVWVVYRNQDTEIKLDLNMRCYPLRALYLTIKEALGQKSKVKKEQKGLVGLKCEKRIRKAKLKSERLNRPLKLSSQFILWYYYDNTAIIYGISNKYYLEIYEGYKWMYENPKEEEKEAYITFEEYAANYKPLIVTQLKKEVLLDWKQRCEKMQKETHD